MYIPYPNILLLSNPCIDAISVNMEHSDELGDEAIAYDNTDIEVISKVFKAFLKENYFSDLKNILLADDVNMHYAVVMDCTALLKVDMTLAEELFHHYDRTMKMLDELLQDVCRDLYESIASKLIVTLKPHVHVRMKNLPLCPELWRDRIPKSKDIGKFLAVEGTVIRTSSVKLLEYKKSLICSKCRSSFELDADFEQCYRIPTPSRCPVRASCNSKKFVMAAKDGSTSNHKCKDFQEIKIQEQLRKLAMGTLPRAIYVILEDDLVDSCKAGDDVIIYGVVKCRWQPLHEGKPCDLETVLKANYVEVRNEHRLGTSVREEMQNDFECFWAAHAVSPFTARNHILASFCPQIYGLYVVKLAVALILAGGVPKQDSSGSRVRGEAHLLMVGDPGTGKSQFLKYAAKITPRSVLTTGIGSTSAGLTVTAIRDGPHWILEAGALVLADGGICCIDEFSSIKEHDRAAIHEAMEQQTVSVAKAGLVCNVNTRTSVLAATNPKLGKYDEAASIDINVGIASPLLSRFDIILVLLDSKNEEWDSIVADYVLTGKDSTNSGSSKDKLWTMDQMQAYFCLIKQINPTLTDDANTILSQYYRYHRKSDFRNAARTTIRLLESLIRIAEAHARLMYRSTVEVMDAIVAVTVMESSMQGASLLPVGNILLSRFPDDPEGQYRNHAMHVLKGLDLEDILQKEMTGAPAQATTLNTVSSTRPPSPPDSKYFTATVQKIASRTLSTQEHHLRSSQLETNDNVHIGDSTWGVNEISYGEFGLGLDTNKSQNRYNNQVVSTQFVPQKDDIENSPPKKVKRPVSTAATDFRTKLQCFAASQDSSPEIPLSGIIKSNRRNKNISHIGLDDDTDSFFEIDLAQPCTSTAVNKSSSSTKTMNMPSIFSLSESISDDFLDMDHMPTVISSQYQANAMPHAKKASGVSLGASVVEKICDNLMLEESGNNSTTLQPFVDRKETCQKNAQPLKELENTSSIFKIDEELDLFDDFEF